MKSRNLLLLVIVLVLLVVLLPAWPYSTGFGYWPSGALGLILLVLLLLIVLEKI
jgi:hypothetical protein